MLFDNCKSFPHPVLAYYNRDYFDAAFQATLELKVSGSSVTLVADYALSESEISGLISARAAAYVAVVKCPAAYYRQAFKTSVERLAHTFEQGELCGRVDVYPFIVAEDSLDAFSSPRFNPEFGGNSFEIPAGGVLALDAPKTYYVDQQHLKIGSAIEIVALRSVADGELDVSVDQQKITVGLSPNTKSRIDAARGDPSLRDYVVTILVLPALLEALRCMRDDEAAHSHKKWFRTIHQRLIDVGFDPDDPPKDDLLMALRLLEQPLSRLPVPGYNGEA